MWVCIVLSTILDECRERIPVIEGQPGCNISI